jgi:hypothetical protein
MGGYEDYGARAASGETVAGICWQRGPNAAIPAQWLLSIEVPRALGEHQFCVLWDPADAVIALVKG